MIPIPRSKRKRALILVDIQQGFLKKWKGPLLANLTKLFSQEEYDLYVEVTFHADKKSLWDMQTSWTFPYEPSVPEVLKLLKDKHVIRVVKETRSSFKGDRDLNKILKRHGIREVHIVGIDLSDCVFATVQEAFDLGFFAYVIEECTGDSQGERIYKSAIAILRSLGLTNHS